MLLLRAWRSNRLTLIFTTILAFFCIVSALPAGGLFDDQQFTPDPKRPGETAKSYATRVRLHKMAPIQAEWDACVEDAVSHYRFLSPSLFISLSLYPDVSAIKSTPSSAQ